MFRINSKLFSHYERLYKFERLVIERLDDNQHLRTMKPLADREAKIISAKLNAEIESAHDEIAKIWKSVSDLERLASKQPMHHHEDINNVGALAAAINK
jgi:hypothetical protein